MTIDLIKWFERNNKFSWGITFIVAVFIFYLSSLEFKSGIGEIGFLSILYHLFAFFIFGGFLLISLLQGKKNNFNFLLGLFISFLYAILDEVHQLFVPGRFATFFDVIVNFVGILSVGIFYFIILSKRKS